MKSVLTLCTLFSLALITPVAGQSGLVLRDVATAWPWITLSFRAYCDSAQVLNVGKTDFTLYENGSKISDFEVWCPDEYVRVAISVALVLDGSASMAGERNVSAKVMAHTFVDLTDGVVDELTVTLFNTAPLDSSTLEPLHLALIGDTVRTGSVLSVPLRIVDPVAGRPRAPFAFTVHYDTTLLKSPRITLGHGSLLESKPLTITPLGNGVRISTGTDAALHAWVEGDKPLFYLLFDALAPEGRGDTIPLAITVSDAAFIDGCPDLHIDDAHAVILAHGPVLLFTGDYPDSLFWNSRSGSWEQPEFDVVVRVYNTGDRDAEDVTLRIGLDETRLRFINPDSAVQSLPGGRLSAGDYAEVIWKVGIRNEVRPPDSVITDMTVHASNHRPGTCRCRMYFAEGLVAVASAPPVAQTPKLWPNPGAGLFTLTFSPVSGDARIIVTDLLGRIVLRENAGPDASPVQLDLSSQSPGLYCVHVLLGTGRKSLPLRIVR